MGEVENCSVFGGLGAGCDSLDGDDDCCRKDKFWLVVAGRRRS